MRAIVYHTYGAPEVLRLAEVPTPTPADGDVLVRVRAAIVSATDSAARRADPFSARLAFGLIRPKASILGDGFAGEVARTGRNVTRFREGDPVVGFTGPALGGHAEYICVPEDGALVARPADLSPTEAVAVCEGPMTALPFLREAAHLRAGQSVLVIGASGAIGTAAVQFARHVGAHVTGVCSTRNVELVRDLGADAVIDYTAEDFTRTDRAWDVIFDTVGASSYRRARGSLTAEGRYLTAVPSLAILPQMLLTRLRGGRRALIAFTGLRSADAKRQDLETITELVAAGALRPVIDRTYPLEQTPDAHRHVDTGHKRGSVVITV